MTPINRDSKGSVRYAAVAAAILFPTFYGCSGSQAPSAPTVSAPLAAVSAAPAGSTSAVSISWTCLTATGTPFSGVCGAMAPTSRLAAASMHAAASPFAPGGLTQAVSGSTVMLSWTPGAATPGEPVYSYIIEAGSASGLSNIVDNFDTGSSASTITVTGVGVGTYYVRMRARSTGGISVPSNEVVVTVLPGGATCSTLPGIPTDLLSLVTGGTVQLAWTVPVGSCTGAYTTYMLEVGSAPGLSNLANIATGAPSFSASGVPAGTYYVRVRSRNANGLSAPSNEIALVVR